jgi:hypothetical protein
MPDMTVRWNLNGKRWTETMTVGLGEVGDTYVVKTLWRGGTFRSKQLEVVVTDAVPFTLKAIDADVEVLP